VLAGVLVSCQGTSEQQFIGDWQSRTSFELEGRSHAATFVIGDIGYVIGGTSGNRTPYRHVLAFDHKAASGRGSWEVKDNFPGPARQQAVGFSLNVKGMDYGFVGTGWHQNDEKLYNDFWRYNPVDDTWEEVAPLPAYPRRGAIAFSLEVNGKEYGYIGCGWTGLTDDIGSLFLSDFYEFDPDGETEIEGQMFMGQWTTVKGSGSNKRSGATVFVIENKAYISTGENTNSANATVTDFWVFDPNGTEKWKRLRAMANLNQNEDYDDDYGPLARSFGVGYVVEGKGHIVGGRSGNGFTNWEYDHIADLWTQRTSFYNNSSRWSREGMVAFSFKTGRAFVGMGKQGTSAYWDDMWEFIPLVPDNVYEDL